MVRLPVGALVLAIAATASVPAAWSQNTPPVVTNVSALQVEGTGTVRIIYDVEDADGDSLYVEVFISSDGGTLFDLIATSVTGDVNRKVAPGTGKEILWDAATDYPGRYWSAVVAKVFVRDGTVLGGEMVLVPAGNFVMGNNACGTDVLTHTVYLDDYLIDKYEVTNAEFRVFIEAGGYSTPEYWSPEGWQWKGGRTQPSDWYQATGYPGYPVRGVSWYEAEAYARFANKRLPTEAEWEKAARGISTSPVWTYAVGPTLSLQQANYSDPASIFLNDWSPVGFFDGRLLPNPLFQTVDSPSPYGTYDQTGNVYEWVADWYEPTYYSISPPSNPTGPLTGYERVFRGGSHDSQPSGPCADLSTWWRGFAQPGGGNPVPGLRCARTP